jgi:PhoD-like phosphatase
MPLQTSLRAVVITAPGASPSVSAVERRSGLAHPATSVTRAPSPPMRSALDARGIEPHAFVVEGLTPDTEYQWSVDGATVAESVRTLPLRLPAEGASILATSCFFGYFEGAAASHLAALRSVAKRERSLFRVMCGDNLYVDVAPDYSRFSDGYAETAERYAHYFAQPPCADVFAAVASCTTWDDHEFWNDFPEAQPHLSRSRDARREPYTRAADEAIELFQLPLNPPPRRPGMRCYSFDLAPLRFFVADSRTRRTPVDDPHAALMPAGELDELTAWLTEPVDGPRVLVLGQPLWTAETETFAAVVKSDHNLPSFPSQYRRILDALRESPYDVLVISGDVHFSRLLQLNFSGSRSVYEFVTSPVSHVSSKVSTALNGLTLGLTRLAGDHSEPKLEGPPRSFRGRPDATRWFFASGAPNTFGVLRFKPIGRSVAVGGGFVDGSQPHGPWLPALGPPDTSVLDARVASVCASDALFVLKDR